MSRLLFIALIVFLSSCETVYYSQPQPRMWPALPAFPKTVQGTYPAFGSKDGIIIYKKGITINNGDEDPMHFELNEDVVIKRYNQYWIVSVYREEAAAWDVYAIDKNRGVKTLVWNKSLPGKINAEFEKDLMTFDSEGELEPISPRRREFKILLDFFFKGVSI